MNEADGYLRIREAAVTLFADRGVAGTSILDIADVAGVSGGLVRHHFGSKEQLRQACDRWVVERLMAGKTRRLEVLGHGGDAAATGIPYSADDVRLMRYLGRATMDGSPEAARNFATLVDVTADWLVAGGGRAPADPRATAALLTAFSLGSAALLGPIADTLGLRTDDPELVRRIGHASTVVFSEAVLPAGASGARRERPTEPEGSAS